VVNGVPGCVLTWTATDDCGNTSVTEQFVSVVDSVSLKLFALPDGEMPLDAASSSRNSASFGNEAVQTMNLPLSEGFPIRVLKVAPNPAEISTRLEFVSTEAVKLSVDLIKMDGTLVMNLFNGMVAPDVPYSRNLSVDALESGIYCIRWATASGTLTRKIIVTH
jgi:hypothetical protein